MAAIRITLPNQMKTWVEERMKDGRFSNTDDYVRHLIRRDQERKAAIDALQRAINEGVDSGAPEPFDFRAFKARMRERNVGK